ncbi:hypothetical protein ANN_06763 [Periplaneta americana]|uniref:Tc1-like transposase DDE domain-containing protein n=1 Tax=Periplaneta americana TaxID=6978 RepID=A0ABQ8TGC0_PERAM|nr:hypothetical protein ANN_06763 [Periplaneta americana]
MKQEGENKKNLGVRRKLEEKKIPLIRGSRDSDLRQVKIVCYLGLATGVAQSVKALACQSEVALGSGTERALRAGTIDDRIRIIPYLLRNELVALPARRIAVFEIIREPAVVRGQGNMADRRQRPDTCRRVSTRAQDAFLDAEVEANPHQSASSIKVNARFPGSSRTVIRRLRDIGRYPRVAATKGCINDDHRLSRLAFAEVNVNFGWNKVIFSGEVTFSSDNYGRQIVYRSRGSRYDPTHVATRFRSGHVSVPWWGWMSSDVLGVLWRLDANLNAQQYKVLMENVMLPSVWMIYPDDDEIIFFQQYNHRVHTCAEVMRWFSERPFIRLIEWPPCSPDLNVLENVWSEVKKTVNAMINTMRRRPTTKDALWSIIEDAWDRVSSRRQYLRRLIASIPRRMQAVIDAEGLHTRY